MTDSTAPSPHAGWLRRVGSPGLSPRIGLVLCALVLAGWLWARLLPDLEVDTRPSAPDWLPLAAAAFAAMAFASAGPSRRATRAGWALTWTGLLLMVWAANGLLFDLLTAAGLIGHREADGTIVMSTVYWPGLTTRLFALATVVVLARLALARPAGPTASRPATWYGYAAFLLALPYPVLRLHWALGGSLGLAYRGAAGEGWEPLLIAIPWVLAAVLSLLLALPPHWMPRRLLVTAGWLGTAIVAVIGPAALWSFVSALASGGRPDTGDIELWVFGLFYGSWFLWAIAAGAATRSYQWRSAASDSPVAT